MAESVRELLYKLAEQNAAEQKRNEDFAILNKYEKTARRQGFRTWKERCLWYNHTHNINKPMHINKDCSLYLGVYWAETILSKIYENVQIMPINNPGYDFICKNGYKIDVKSSCLGIENRWVFSIKKNKIADFFLLIAFDNRESKKPEHIWLIKNNECIITERKSYPLNEKRLVTIHNTEISLFNYKPYEQTTKLEKAINYCNTLR